MWPDVQLSCFNSLFGEFNLQDVWMSKSWENICWELSYFIVAEIPRVEKMLSNEKPLNQ